MNRYPIYIPSKGRYENALTARLLIEQNLHFYIVIEPQDFNNYLQYFDSKNLIRMDENNKGIAYVRNWCKQHAIKEGYPYHWQFDDNIKSFRIREGDKNVKTSPLNCITEVEKIVSTYSNIGIAGLRHTIFAFSQTKPVSLNQQCYSGVLVNNSLKINWRDKIVEDTDYSLQVLFSNYCTLLFNRLLIEKATTMSMKGGHTTSTYAGNGRTINQQNLIKQWPGLFELTTQYGRTKIKPSRIWSKFSQVPVKL
jgi:hypothetical protein